MSTENKIIRKESRSRNGYNNGDIDVAFQLFPCGMVWDGNLASKESRNHFLKNGYAVKYEGMQAMTGKGTIAFLLSPIIWISAFKRWRKWKKNPFIAKPIEIERAMD